MSQSIYGHMKDIWRVSMKDTKKSYMKRTIGAVLGSPSECNKKRNKNSHYRALNTVTLSHFFYLQWIMCKEKCSNHEKAFSCETNNIKLHQKVSIYPPSQKVVSLINNKIAQ